MVEIRPLVSGGFDLWTSKVTVSDIGFFGKGTIQIETGWQLISIPVQHGFWDKTTHALVHDGTTIAKFKNYVLDQLEDLYGPGVVEVANTYTGDNQAFYSYVVGSTPESSPHNFNLVYQDGSSYEIAGFWIKSVYAEPMLIDWGE